MIVSTTTGCPSRAHSTPRMHLALPHISPALHPTLARTSKISISCAAASVGCPVPARTVVLRPAISEAAEESALRAEFAELAMVP